MLAMEKLNEYLDGRKKSQFAELIGISAPYLSQLCSGVRTPGIRVAIKIDEATDGAVPVSAWRDVE